MFGLLDKHLEDGGVGVGGFISKQEPGNALLCVFLHIQSKRRVSKAALLARRGSNTAGFNKDGIGHIKT